MMIEWDDLPKQVVVAVIRSIVQISMIRLIAISEGLIFQYVLGCSVLLPSQHATRGYHFPQNRHHLTMEILLQVLLFSIV
jgi:hypothetical protein